MISCVCCRSCFDGHSSRLFAFDRAGDSRLRRLGAGWRGENAPGQWNKAAAVGYLDRRGAEWFKFGGARRGQGASTTSCVSCHTLLPYALARPVLRRMSGDKTPTEYETKALDQVKSRVTNWDRLDTEAFQLFYDFDHAKKIQSRGTEAVLCRSGAVARRSI